MMFLFAFESNFNKTETTRYNVADYIEPTVEHLQRQGARREEWELQIQQLSAQNDSI